MTRQKASPKRAYLARDDRRAALLDVAATVVVEQGWQALSMISVAETAEVSRQLVYQHFASVDELMADTMSHLFRDRFEKIRESIQANSGDLAGLMRIVGQQTFDEKPGHVRALWQMITATYSDNAETSRMGRRLRHLLTKLWSPLIAQQLSCSAEQSQAIAWMLHMSFWGAHQLVHDGEMSRKSADDLFTWMLLRLTSVEARKGIAKAATKPKTEAPLQTDVVKAKTARKITAPNKPFPVQQR